MGKPSPHNQFVADVFKQAFVINRQEAANVDDAVFFGAHRSPVGQGEDFLSDLQRGFIGITRFAQLDEIGVLGEAAGVQ